MDGHIYLPSIPIAKPKINHEYLFSTLHKVNIFKIS